MINLGIEDFALWLPSSLLGFETIVSNYIRRRHVVWANAPYLVCNAFHVLL